MTQNPIPSPTPAPTPSTPVPSPAPTTPVPYPAPTQSAPTYSVCPQSGLQGIELFEAATGHAVSGSAISTVAAWKLPGGVQHRTACLGVQDCMAFTYTAADASECVLYSSAATLQQLVAAAGSSYYKLAECYIY